ncbi:MAG: hypothetical protein ACLR23_12175 [Clostridia bacterium]
MAVSPSPTTCWRAGELPVAALLTERELTANHLLHKLLVMSGRRDGSIGRARGMKAVLSGAAGTSAAIFDSMYSINICGILEKCSHSKEIGGSTSKWRNDSRGNSTPLWSSN